MKSRFAYDACVGFAPLADHHYSVARHSGGTPFRPKDSLAPDALRAVVAGGYPVGKVVNRLKCQTGGSKHVTVTFLNPSQAHSP